MYFGERTFQDMQSWQKIIGKTYYQKHPNNENEYRTIYMKYNAFAGKVQASPELISSYILKYCLAEANGSKVPAFS